MDPWETALFTSLFDLGLEQGLPRTSQRKHKHGPIQV